MVLARRRKTLRRASRGCQLHHILPHLSFTRRGRGVQQAPVTIVWHPDRSRCGRTPLCPDVRHPRL